jgi:hypothetical protein
LFRALRLLEPYGVGNPEPAFSVCGVQLAAPPRIIKDKHVKLKLRAGVRAPQAVEIVPQEIMAQDVAPEELSAVAVAVAPSCDPDSSTIGRAEKKAASEQLRTENRELRTGSWRDSVVFEAMGWRMAERLQQSPLLSGDAIDIAFTLGHNEHPEYGGLELSLRDLRLAER